MGGEHRNDSGLSAAGGEDDSHAQDRRHRPADFPDDGHWRILLYVAGHSAQARRAVGTVSDESGDDDLQLHRVRHQNL